MAAVQTNGIPPLRDTDTKSPEVKEAPLSANDQAGLAGGRAPDDIKATLSQIDKHVSEMAEAIKQLKVTQLAAVPATAEPAAAPVPAATTTTTPSTADPKPAETASATTTKPASDDPPKPLTPRECPKTCIPQIRDCSSMSEFQNYIGEEQSQYAIEVLTAGAEFDRDATGYWGMSGASIYDSARANRKGARRAKGMQSVRINSEVSRSSWQSNQVQLMNVYESRHHRKWNPSSEFIIPM